MVSRREIPARHGLGRCEVLALIKPPPPSHRMNAWGVPRRSWHGEVGDRVEHSGQHQQPTHILDNAKILNNSKIQLHGRKPLFCWHVGILLQAAMCVRAWPIAVLERSMSGARLLTKTVEERSPDTNLDTEVLWRDQEGWKGRRERFPSPRGGGPDVRDGKFRVRTRPARSLRVAVSLGRGCRDASGMRP